MKNCIVFALFLFSPAAIPQVPNPSPQRVVKAVEQPPIGTFINGRFHHTLTGTEFSLPQDWTVSYQGKSSGGGEQIGFTLAGNSTTPPIEAFVWMKADALTSGEIPDQLRSDVDFKAGMRQSMPGYKMLKNTIDRKTIAGQLALSVQAQFDKGNDKMIEYHTWVRSEKTHVYLSARVREADFADGQSRIDQILGSFLVP